MLEALLEVPAERLEALRALVPVYQRAGRDEPLLAALEGLAAGTDRIGERTSALKGVAELQRRHHQPDLAFAALARALESNPADPALQELAEQAAVEADALDTLVEVLADQVDRASGHGRALIRLRLAGIEERRLNNPLAAIEHLRAAIAASPHELAALENLRRLHTTRQEWAALGEVLEKLARLQPVLAEQIATWREAAVLHEQRLGDESSALTCWGKVLDLAPYDREAIDGVRRLATLLERPTELARVQNAQKAFVATPVEPPAPPPPPPPPPPAAAPPAEPDNPTQALLKGLKAFEEGFDRLRKLPELLRLAEEADALEELAEAVEAGSEETGDDAELAELLRFVARLRERLKQPAPAKVAWNDLLAVRPEDPEALEHLLALFKLSGEVKNAAEVGLRRARLSTGAQKLERVLEAASLYEDAGAATEAIRAFEESLSLGADLRALRALNRLLVDRAEPALQARVLDELARLEPATAQGKLHLRRAQLLVSSDPAGAAGAYAQALNAGGAEAEAIAALHALLGSAKARLAAAKSLEPVYRARREVRALAEVIEAQLEEGGSKTERLARLTEVASLWEQAGEPRSALSARLRAFTLSGGDEQVRTELARLAGTLGADEELLAAYEEALERGLVPRPGPLWRRVAELQDARGQRDQGAAAWEKAVEATPGDTALLRAFGDRCRAQGDLTRLADVLKRHVEAEQDPARQTALLGELARLAEEKLADDARAAWAWEELSRRSPRDRALLTSLHRLYERSGDAAGQAGVLARELQLSREAGAPDALALALKLAQLKLERARDDAGAFGLLTEVLRQQPKNVDAVAGLVRLASSPGPIREEAARAVAPMLDTLGDHGALVRLLTAQVAAQSDPTERARLWRQISDLQAGPLKDAESAFLAAAKALRETPRDPALLQRCVFLADEAKALDELGALLEELAGVQPRGASRAALFRALARTRETSGERDEAIAAWTEVQSLSPADPEAHQRLRGLLEQAGRHSELATLLQQRAEAASPTERPAALLALAAAREQLGQLEPAIETLHSLFALTRGLDALTALERVLGKLGRHRERAEVLGRVAAATVDARARSEWLIQQARALIAAREPELAVALLTELLSRAPGDDRLITELVALAAEPRVSGKVIDALTPVYRDADHRRQRLAVLEVLVTNGGPQREGPLRTELAALYEALGAHRQAFVERLRLVRLFVGNDEARAEVERVAGVAKMEEELVGAYEDLIEQGPPPPVALALCRTLARLSVRLSDPESAARWWEEVARRDPSNLEPLHALADLYRAAGKPAALAQVLWRQVPLLPAVDAQIDALTELGGLAEDVSDWGLAADAYRQVLGRTPSDLNALRALGRMLQRLELHAELAEVLRRQLAYADTHQRTDEGADTELRLGQLALGPLEQPEAALNHFARVLLRRPDDPAAVTGLETLLARSEALRKPVATVLEPVYRKRPDPRRLAEALELQLPGAPPEREQQLLQELAAVREGLGDPGRAYQALRELFTRTPAEPKLRAELERLAEATSQLEDLTALYREQLGKGLSDALTVELWRRVAGTHQRLGQRRKAAEAWEEVARRRQTEAEPLVALCALYREERAFAELPRLLRQRAELQVPLEEQVALLLELVDVAELQLSDATLAIDSCRAAFTRAPHDRRVLGVLERLLEEYRHFDELAELLLGQITRAETNRDEPFELSLRVRLGRVRHRALGDEAGALELLGGVLARQPNHPDALSAVEAVMRAGTAAADAAAALLEPIYERSRAWLPLLEVLGVRAGASTGEVRAGFLHRIADLQELQLDQPAEALETVSGLLRERPDDALALQRALILAPPAKAEGKLAALLAEVLPRAADPATQAALLRPLAGLREKLADPAGGLESWRALLTLLPADDEALAATVRLLEASWRWGELVEVLEARLPHTAAPAARAALLSRIGSVRADSLGDAKGAYSAFRRVLEFSPDDLPSLLRLDGLCEQLGRWQEQAEVLARRIRLEPTEQQSLRLRLAAVRRARLGDPGGALPLLGEVLQAAPGHPGALLELEQLVELEADFGPASELALAGYRQLGDAARLGGFLEWRAGLAGDGPRRRALWLELARVRLDQQQDPELGFLAIARAYRESPSDPALRSQALEVAATAGSQDAVAALLEEVLPGLDPPNVAETSLALGALYENALKDPERAAASYRRALAAVPESAPRALAGLDRVLSGMGGWAELLPVLEACLAAARDPSERVGLLLRIAAVAAERLEKTDRAEQALKEVLRLEPGHLAAARGLETLYEKTGQAEPLLGVLEHLLVQLPARDRQPVRLKLARRCGETKPERAIALCRELLADDPLHGEGFALLVGHLERARKHEQLGELLTSRRAVTLDPGELASLEFQLGELSHRRLDQPKAAIPHYREVLERAPRHVGALTALVEIFEALGQRRELAQALGDLAEVTEAPAERGVHLVSRAEVLIELGSRDLALASARAALELLPDDERPLTRLCAILRAFDAAPEMARALDRLGAAQVRERHTAPAVKTLLELAAVRERLAELPAAAAALEKVLTLEPSNRAAFDRARALFTRTDDAAGLAGVLARFLPHLPPGERAAALDELAQLHEARLADPAAAFGWASQAVQLDPLPAPRRERLERLATALKKAPELAALYRAILERAGAGAARERLTLALAAIEDLQLDQVDEAEKTLHALLASEPGNQAALDALAALFTRRGLHARHGSALELKLEATAAPKERAELLERLANLHEQQLSDPAAAAHALRRLVELTKEPRSASLLAALHRRHQQWPQTLEALQQLLKLSPPALRVEVQLEIAELYETQLSDLESAVNGYNQALALDPASADAFEALQRLYRKLDRPAELLRIFEQRLSQTADVDEQVALLYSAAELWERKSSSQQADRRLERVLELKPNETRALEGLERLRRAGKRWTALAETLTRHLEVASSPAQKAGLCGTLGELHQQELRDDEGAVKWWRRALDFLPDHRPALHALAELHQKHGRWPEATRLLAREAELETAPAAKAELEHQAGVLREERLHDLPAAIASYQRALAAAPAHLGSLRRLRALYQRASDWPNYEQTLAQEAERAPDSLDRAAAGLELGRHFQTRAKDGPAATKWFEHALKHNPGSLEAALPLCDLLAASKDWSRAGAVLTIAVSILEGGGDSKRRELVTRLCRLGEVKRQLKEPAPALAAFDRALELEPQDAIALQGRAELYEEAGKAAEAAEQYGLLLRLHEKTIKPPARAELRVRLAGLLKKLSKADEALAAAERALEADPVHAAALRIAIGLTDQAGAWEKATLFRQRLAGVATGDERYWALVEMGTLAREKLKNPVLAVTGYSKALELKPNSLEVLEHFHVALRDAGQTQKAAEAWMTLVGHPELAEAPRRQHTLALAEFLSTTLRDEDRAVAVLEAGLDRAPDFLAALQALEALLAKSKSWKLLADCYRRMIHRLDGRPDSGSAQAVLWRTLAELQQRRLKDSSAAVQAWAASARLTPDDAVAQEALADFAITLPDYEEDAVAAYVRAIPGSADPARICGALARVAEKRRDPDSMVLAAQSAALVGGTGQFEQQVLREYGRFVRSPAVLRTPVTEVQWKTLLLHPALRGPLGKLMAFLYEAAGPKFAIGLGDLKLHPKKHLMPDSTEPALNNLRVVARTLGFEALPIYSPFLAARAAGRPERHPDDAVAVRVNPTAPLSLFVGEALLREEGLPQQCALIASTLVLLRPELALAALLPTRSLAEVIEAALTIAVPTWTMRGDPKGVKAEQKRLGKALTPEGKARLGALVAELLSSGKPNFADSYLAGVHHTAARAALLVAGDFAPLQARVLPKEGPRAHVSTRELVSFAVGGDLHSLRMETGAQLTAR